MTYLPNHNLTINVKDNPYNAKGDGVTDDSAAITSANTAAGSTRTLFFPAGTYKINSNVNITATLAMDPGAILSTSNATVTVSNNLASAYPHQQLFGGTGFVSSVSHTGTGPAGAVTVTGNPSGEFNFIVTITTGGALGAAIFKYSYLPLVGGLGEFTNNTTAATFTIPGTGITLNFASGTYVTNDTYTFSTAPNALFNITTTALNPKWWGAKGDFSNDDTGAVQTALNNLVINDGGVFDLPIGDYKITSTLIFGKNFGFPGTRFRGTFGDSPDVGSGLTWAGPDDGYLMKMWNISGSTFEHITFSGGIVGGTHGASTALWIMENPAIPYPNTTTSTEDVYFWRCAFGGCAGTDSAVVRIGDGTGRDIAEVRFDTCTFNGNEDGLGNQTTERLVKIQAGFNNKNYAFTNCLFRNYKYSAIAAPVLNSGTLLISHASFSTDSGPGNQGGQIADVEVVALQDLIILGAESEGSARMLYGSSGNIFGSCIIEDYIWQGNAVDASSNPESPFAIQDAVVVWSGASLSMRGCLLDNARVPGVSVPKVFVNVDNRLSGCSFLSDSNYYQNATFLPVYDNVQNQNLMVDWADFAKTVNISLFSRGDIGGPDGGLIHFPPYDGENVKNGRQSLFVQFSDIGTAGSSKINSGIMTTATAKFSLDFTDFQTAAATRSLVLAYQPPKTRILSVVANTTTPYGWTSGSDTIQLGVGDQANGLQGLILNHDVKTAAVVKGQNNADVGASLASAPFGFVGSFTAQQFTNVTLTSGAQNLSGLNAGHTDVYITFQVLP